MTNKHDFKAALDGYKRAKDNFDINVWLNTYVEEFVTALRIADRLQSGEVSLEMADAFRGYLDDGNSVELISNVFKAMAQQLIKEVEDER